MADVALLLAFQARSPTIEPSVSLLAVNKRDRGLQAESKSARVRLPGGEVSRPTQIGVDLMKALSAWSTPTLVSMQSGLEAETNCSDSNQAKRANPVEFLAGEGCFVGEEGIEGPS